MARKRKRGSRRQGVVSWGTSAIALGIGLSPVIKHFTSGADLNTIFTAIRNNYVPQAGLANRDALIEGYGSILGAVLFKKATSALVQSAKMRSIVPSF